ncbi:MAG TPA: hypothetical protein PK006_04440 [Saprospiraceae bacterium]|nr:hypothetical protein [Saprospiraceae bacterium]
MSKSKITSAIVLVLILIILPIFAWYFLQKGTQMRKDAMQDLNPKGGVDLFQLTTDDDSTFTQSHFLTKKWLVCFFEHDSIGLQSLQIIKSINKQASEDFVLNVFSVMGLKEGELIKDASYKHDISNFKFWKKAYIANVHLYKFCDKVFQVPLELYNKPVALLLDQNSQIRAYYNLEDPESVKMLVKQLPVFLSLKN